MRKMEQIQKSALYKNIQLCLQEFILKTTLCAGVTNGFVTSFEVVLVTWLWQTGAGGKLEVSSQGQDKP